MNAQFLRIRNLGFERRDAEVGVHADHVRTEFVHDGLGVINQRRVVVERDDADVRHFASAA